MRRSWTIACGVLALGAGATFAHAQAPLPPAPPPLAAPVDPPPPAAPVAAPPPAAPVDPAPTTDAAAAPPAPPAQPVAPTTAPVAPALTTEAPIEVTAERVDAMPAERPSPTRVGIFIGGGGRYLGPDSWTAANHQVFGMAGAFVDLRQSFGVSGNLSYGRASGMIGTDEGVDVSTSMIIVSAGIRGLFKTSYVGAELGYVRGTLSRSTPDVMFEDTVGSPALVLVFGNYKPNGRALLGIEGRVTLAPSTGERDVAMASIQFELLIGARVAGPRWGATQVATSSESSTAMSSQPPPSTSSSGGTATGSTAMTTSHGTLTIGTVAPPTPPSTTTPPAGGIGDVLVALQAGQRIHVVRVAGDAIDGTVVSATRTELQVQLKFQQITIAATDIADLSVVKESTDAP